MRTVALAALAAFALAAGTAGAAPARDALIRPGVGIGKVRVGMTFSHVVRALGRPDAVLKQRRLLRSGTRYVEYGWGGGTDWIVAIYGVRGRERVVSVATGLRRERTSKGAGVGSTERALLRAVSPRCFGKVGTAYYPAVYKDTMTCFLGTRQRANLRNALRAAHTGFSLIQDCLVVVPAHSRCPLAKRVYLVYEVRVAEPRFLFGYSGASRIP